MGRISLNDTVMDAAVKMAEGNPGALTTIFDLIEHTSEIDPASMFGAAGKLMILDDYRIYGTQIYVLYNDVCNRDVRTFIMLLRATQLGFFDEYRLKELAADQCRTNLLTPDELDALDEKVCSELSDFKRKPEAEAQC